MSDRYQFTILGCGPSPGVPRPNGDWGACDPNNPKNERYRSSLLVERIKPSGKKQQWLLTLVQILDHK